MLPRKRSAPSREETSKIDEAFLQAAEQEGYEDNWNLSFNPVGIVVGTTTWQAPAQPPKEKHKVELVL